MQRYQLSTSQRDGPGRRARRLKTIESSSMAFFGSYAVVLIGKNCPTSTATGKASTSALPAGPRPWY